jgi:hypothetical protein
MKRFDGNRQNAMIEHGPYRVREPFVQLVAAGASFTQKLNAETKPGQCHRAYIKLVKRMR